jgi:hypothetical protein
MCGNSRGSYRTTKANMMRAFDRLPPEARAALADAVGNWVPQPSSRVSVAAARDIGTAPKSPGKSPAGMRRRLQRGKSSAAGASALTRFFSEREKS